MKDRTIDHDAAVKYVLSLAEKESHVPSPNWTSEINHVAAMAEWALVLREALLQAKQFIENGAEFGYIRMPTSQDPAVENTPQNMRRSVAGAQIMNLQEAREVLADEDRAAERCGFTPNGRLVEALRTALAEVERLMAERDGMLGLLADAYEYIDRLEQTEIAEPATCKEADGCPTEKAVLQREWRAQAARIEALEKALRELYATVKGECPSLLNEDSGGSAQLDITIQELLEPKS